MRYYSFYHKVTGELHPHVFGTDDKSMLAGNTPPDHVAIEGKLDRLSMRVDVTRSPPVIVDHQPPQPSADDEWNAKTKRWQLKAEVVARANERAAAIARIAQLDASSVPILREYAIGISGTREKLKAINDEVAALRLIAGVTT
jgi:hypothetical protein